MLILYLEKRRDTKINLIHLVAENGSLFINLEQMGEGQGVHMLNFSFFPWSSVKSS